MVIRLEIVEGYLIGKKPNGEIINIGPIMPLIKRRKDPIDGKERWKDGSFLTEQQAIDEKYQKKNKIS